MSVYGVSPILLLHNGNNVKLRVNRLCVQPWFFFSGTSDEHIAVVEKVKSLNPDGAVLVTTPQVCRPSNLCDLEKAFSL